MIFLQFKKTDTSTPEKTTPKKPDLREGLKFLQELREMPLDYSKAGKTFVQSVPKQKGSNKIS